IVVVHTIARVTMKAAAAAKTGWQCAAIHNRTGNNSAIGTTVVQGFGGNAMTMTLMTMSDASAMSPSMVSFRAGGSRAAEASPSPGGRSEAAAGAEEATTPRGVTESGGGAKGNKATPGVPPMPETAVATIAAPNKPSTWRSRSRLKGEPK